MKKDVRELPIRELAEMFPGINFPEYQRESNLWALSEKQRLLDSIVRQFDIASLYFYEHDDGVLDCVDGRQRISAIMSFLELNEADQDHNGFAFRILNEVYEDQGPKFAWAQGRTYNDIVSDESQNSQEFQEAIEGYKVTFVRLSESELSEEFNLQFTRLNLGTIINSGEKLNAMVGDLREECYGGSGLGAHGFLASTAIPTRRYSREQVAAQILAQSFALQDSADKTEPEYARTRHIDLQRLFKDHAKLSPARREAIGRVSGILNLLHKAFEEKKKLRNRAMTVSAVILAWQAGIETEEEAVKVAQFLDELQCRLAWQVGKGLDVDDEYRYLVDFQRHVTQASVEKPAVAERARVMKQQYEWWLETETLKGDEEWRQRTGGDPSEECRK